MNIARTFTRRPVALLIIGVLALIVASGDAAEAASRPLPRRCKRDASAARGPWVGVRRTINGEGTKYDLCDTEITLAFDPQLRVDGKHVRLILLASREIRVLANDDFPSITGAGIWASGTDELSGTRETLTLNFILSVDGKAEQHQFTIQLFRPELDSLTSADMDEGEGAFAATDIDASSDTPSTESFPDDAESVSDELGERASPEAVFSE